MFTTTILFVHVTRNVLRRSTRRPTARLRRWRPTPGCRPSTPRSGQPATLIIIIIIIIITSISILIIINMLLSLYYCIIVITATAMQPGSQAWSQAARRSQGSWAAKQPGSQAARRPGSQLASLGSKQKSSTSPPLTAGRPGLLRSSRGTSGARRGQSCVFP